MLSNKSVPSSQGPSNIQFYMAENSRKQIKLPQKPVQIRSTIVSGLDWTVQPPDISIDGVSGFEVDYLKGLA